MTEQAQPGQLLETTAYWTAAVRASEHFRQDRLFDDPWAAALAGEVGETWMAQRTAIGIIPIVLRTRFFDDFLQRITQQEAIRQVVLVAAGLDTRAFRLSWPAGTRLFELDRPAVLDYKEQVLRSAGAQPACERFVIEVDLTAPWQEALVASGFDPQRPSLWLLEGFLFYLANEDITRILDDASSLAVPGSWIGFDINNSATFTSEWTRDWLKMQADAGAPWVGWMDDPEGFMAARGWKASLTQAGAKEANHRRWPFPIFPTRMPDIPHNWFVTACKDQGTGNQ